MPCLQSLLAFSVLAAATTATTTADVLRYVDPLVGAANGGNVFAGASLPYGMAKAVADTASGSNQGGFTLDGAPVSGFSMMHDSGTGGSPSLGNFPLFAYASCGGDDDDVDGCAFPKKDRVRYGGFDRTNVTARPGVFSIGLDSGIAVNMTTTQHTALFEFTFPPGTKHPLILQDLSDLSDSRQDNASVHVDAATGRITGSGRFSPSFGSGSYVLHFCTDFSGSGADVLDAGVFVNSRASTGVHDLTISRSINGYPLPGGAFVRFSLSSSSSGDSPVTARMATSFVSVEQACAHAEREVPDFAFGDVAAAATEVWRDKMSTIRVSPGGNSTTTNNATTTLLRTFYSGIYRTMINPQNYTGENPLWTSSEPYYDSFYCLWDLFRSQMPFLTIIDPAALTEMLRSLVDTYRHEGWLPDCRMSLCKGFTQGGSNADTVLADAYVKGVGVEGDDGLDWTDAYAAVVQDAEVEPYDWSSEGRGGLDSWKALGYVPVADWDYKGFGTMTRSVSRTLEYSYNDYCIAQMAAGLKNPSDEAKYLGRSDNWRNLFRNDTASHWANGSDTGFTGFFQPRNLNRTWSYQDPLQCSNPDTTSVCSLQNTGRETFESSLWEYGFFVPHDQAALVQLYGGDDAFVRRLNYLHDSGIIYIGNEPSFLTVFQYHFAGRPGLSAERVHTYVPAFFQPTPEGLPGNDDSGAMGSFVAFAMMGLFPNPGQNVYLVVPPFFARVDVTHPLTGKTATIRSINHNAGLYIQSATLNGKPYTKSWLDHSFFTDGKELVLTLGSKESDWGRRAANRPPSVSDYV